MRSPAPAVTARPARGRAAVELPARDPRRRRPRRARRRQRGDPQACTPESRCTAAADRGAVLGRRHRTRRPPVPPGRRRRRRSPAHHPPRHRRSDPHRLLRHGADVPRMAARSPAARRDQRQERASSSPATADIDLAVAGPRPVRVRPRRPEVLGGEPRDRRGAPVRRPSVPRTSRRRRCAACASVRGRPRHRRRPAHRRVPATCSGARCTTLDAGRGVAASDPRPLGRRGGCGAPASASACVPGRGSTAPSASVPCSASCRADDLDHAIAAPERHRLRAHRRHLQSLDPDEIALWLERVEVGNALRQPRHHRRHRAAPTVRRLEALAVGPTAKAGGPNYVNTLVRWHDTGVDIDMVAADFRQWMRDIGHRDHDPTGLAAERNVLRYRPLSGAVLVRCGSHVPPVERELDDGRLARDGRRCRVVRRFSRTRGRARRHESEHLVSSGFESSATTRIRRPTSSVLLPMPPGCRLTTRPLSAPRRSSYRGGCASSR